MDGLAGDPGRVRNLADVQLARVDMPDNPLPQLLLGLTRRRFQRTDLARLLLQRLEQPGGAFIGAFAFLPIARPTARVAGHQSPIPRPYPRERVGSPRNPGR